MAKFNELLGKTLKSIQIDKGHDEIYFETEEGQFYKMYHEADCCEQVFIEDVCGSPEALIGTPLLLAEEVSNYDRGPRDKDYDDSYTWTFYKLATILGNLTLRWYGSSNGYYSESVDFIKRNSDGEYDRWGEDDSPGW